MNNFKTDRVLQRTWSFAPPRRRWWRAFTLIELLVVISIIGVLAGLVLGLTGVATRKSKEGRIRVEMNKLVNAIENYKSTLGFYPPDNPGRPTPNQLFYELSGTFYQNNQFYVVGRSEPISAAAIQSYFKSSGFANAARDPKDVKFSEEFKASQYKRISANPPIDILVVPVPGPRPGPNSWTIDLGAGGGLVNPWLYVSTGATNNPERFDLWAEVIVGGKRVRYSNWEKDPVTLSP
jgi:prepilin-type N-terminal cleavage/methylation domain-containing protein